MVVIGNMKMGLRIICTGVVRVLFSQRYWGLIWFIQEHKTLHGISYPVMEINSHSKCLLYPSIAYQILAWLLWNWGSQIHKTL